RIRIYGGSQGSPVRLADGSLDRPRVWVRGPLLRWERDEAATAPEELLARVPGGSCQLQTNRSARCGALLCGNCTAGGEEGLQEPGLLHAVPGPDENPGSLLGAPVLSVHRVDPEI